MAGSYTVRRATADDVDDLLRLRLVTFDAMDGPATRAVPSPSSPWLEECRAFLLEGFVADTVAAFVAAAHVDRRVVDGGVGDVQRRLASPGNPTGSYGHIASMATEPGWRGRGIGRAVAEQLLGEPAESRVHEYAAERMMTR